MDLRAESNVFPKASCFKERFLGGFRAEEAEDPDFSESDDDSKSTAAAPPPSTTGVLAVLRTERLAEGSRKQIVHHRTPPDTPTTTLYIHVLFTGGCCLTLTKNVDTI